MGCVCSKNLPDEDNSNIKKKKKKKLKKPKWAQNLSSKRLLSSSREAQAAVEDEESQRNEIKIERVESNAVTHVPSPLEKEENNEVPGYNKAEVAVPQLQRWVSMEADLRGPKHQLCRGLCVSNGVDGAQVVAGWPSWLSAVAGEAIQGWLPRKSESFQKLEKIGQGTYSSVYKARDLETGKLVALKKVKFCSMDPESVRFMAREILILRLLDHPNVMRLHGLITSRVSTNVNLIFEYMEHDLAGLITSPMVNFTQPQIKCYMKQLLSGLEYCHSRGVLHRDIKGSNLLLDNNGTLKIADFGLATIVSANQKRPLTSRVVTLWYRPPELLLGSTDYGVGVDLWSTGCILAELFARRPIMPGRTEVEQLHKIFKLCGSPSDEYWKKMKLPHGKIFKPLRPYDRCLGQVFKDFPPPTLALLETLLCFEPENRGTTTSALNSEFFSTEPLACDTSSMPRYPPSKEFDARARYEKLRRQSLAGGRRARHDSSKKQSRAAPAPVNNAELQAAIEANRNSKADRFDKQDGDSIEPSRRSLPTGTLDNNSLDQMHYADRRLSSLKPLDVSKSQLRASAVASARLSTFSQQMSDAGYSSPDSAYRSNGEERYPLKKKKKKKNKSTRSSGPGGGGSVEKLIQEHEKLIQIAIRKSRLDRNKSRNCQSDAVLQDFMPDL